MQHIAGTGRQQTKHFKRMVKLSHGTIESVFGNLINYLRIKINKCLRK